MFRPVIQKTRYLVALAIFNYLMFLWASHTITIEKAIRYDYKIHAAARIGYTGWSATGSNVGKEVERNSKCRRWIDPAFGKRWVLIGRDRTQYDAIGRFGIAQNFVGERCSRALKQ